MTPDGLRSLNPNCQTAARLISDTRERPLSRTERIGLCVHLALCNRCRRYRGQVRLIDAWIGTLDAARTPAPLPADARLRIERRLAESAES